MEPLPAVPAVAVPLGPHAERVRPAEGNARPPRHGPRLKFRHRHPLNGNVSL